MYSNNLNQKYIIFQTIEHVWSYFNLIKVLSRNHQQLESACGCPSPLCLHGKHLNTKTHYMFQILKSLKNAYQATERLNDLGKRVFLYGMVCLFSMNFVQGTVIGAVIAWANLILLIIAHCFVFLK